MADRSNGAIDAPPGTNDIHPIEVGIGFALLVLVFWQALIGIEGVMKAFHETKCIVEQYEAYEAKELEERHPCQIMMKRRIHNPHTRTGIFQGDILTSNSASRTSEANRSILRCKHLRL